MRYSFVGLLLLVFSSTVLAQTTVPFIFPPGPAAGARFSEVNANFQALATAIDALTARVSKLERPLTAADVAGTYAFISLEVETGTGTTSMVHHAIGNGSATLNDDGTFSLSATDNSSHLNLIFSGTSLTANTTTDSASLNDSGTWSLDGKVLTLVFSGAQISVPFINAAGPSLFLSAVLSTDRRDHSLVFLIRIN
jgi:hypothetical protein